MRKRFFAGKNTILLCLILIVSMAFPCVSNAKEKKTVTVGYDLNEGNALSDENDYKSGYYYEYLQTIAVDADWDYEYVYGTRDELLEMLKNGEIDVMPGMTADDCEAGNVLLPTRAMGFKNYYLYTQENGKLSACNLIEIKGARVGYIKGSITEKCFKNWNAYNDDLCIPVEYNDAQAMYKELSEGKIDALVDSEEINIYENGLAPILNVGKNDFFLGVSKNRKDLLTDLNATLDEINTKNPYLIYTLQNKYFDDDLFGATLSAEDKEYLGQKGTIRIAYEKNFLSFCGYDEKTGECLGALKVFTDGMVQNYGRDVIGVELVPYENVEESIDALNRGEVDLVFPMYQSYYAAEHEGLLLTNGISSTGMTAITDKNKSFNEFADNRVAVADGFTDIVWYIEENYPNWTIVEYDTFDDCQAAIHSGEADCIVESTYVYKNLLDYRTVKMVALSKRAELCFAVSKSNSKLTHIMNHAITANDEGNFFAALSFFANVETKTTFTDLVRDNVVSVGIAGASVVLVLALLLVKVAVEQKKTKETKAELEEALKGAEAASKAKTVFLNNMSHDIRTPMNAIMGYSGLIEKNKNNPEMVSDYLGKISMSGEYLLAVINNVLDMARIESGNVELEETLVNIEAVADDFMNMFSGDLNKKNLHLTHTMKVEHPCIICDVTKTSQIAINLLSNAIKYTPEGGNITVSVREIPCEKEGYATFVSKYVDNGIGMSPEYVEHIFDSFSRERNTTQSKVAGTGLGMAICKKLVDLMGGTIEVKSESGKGTTFTVTLTHKIADPSDYVPKTGTKIDMTDEKFAGKRILLAEDNELNYEIASVILEDAGFLVEHARDGVECVSRMSSSEPGYYDLILMDIQMPNMDGYKATRVIREMQDEIKKSIPIIAVTANAFEEDVEKAFNAGMNGHIAKPIKIDQLKSTLAKVLETE